MLAKFEAVDASEDPDQRPTTPRIDKARDAGLARSQRITRTSDFRESYDSGKRWFGRLMVLWLREAEGASLRLGVVSSRKVGGAVARNRARRLLRDVFRRHRAELHGACDIVLVARKNILDASREEIEEELLRLAGEAGLTNDV